MPSHPQDRTLSLSLRSLEEFWSHHAAQLHWHKPPSASLRRSSKTLPASGVTHEHWSWFPDGEISTTYNCVDRHVLSGHGDDVAIIYESPVTGVRERYTYAQLLDEVEVLAGVLREEGIRKGDVVLIFSMFYYYYYFFFFASLSLSLSLSLSSFGLCSCPFALEIHLYYCDMPVLQASCPPANF
ncbi:acyl-CoA synthetase [Histoplasma ohiense]|nr:acyl-CoA synthetase [Histoplasma ohiense (nom. inval.)]